MKYTKKLQIFLTLLLVAILFSNKTFARAETQIDTAEVLGNVYSCSEDIQYANVVATCGSQTLSGSTGSTTGDSGKYSITFNNPTCVNGSTVNVTAFVNGNEYSNSGVMGSFLWFDTKANVNIQVGDSCGEDEVPEFGLVTGAFTALASAGSYFALKRKL